MVVDPWKKVLLEENKLKAEAEKALGIPTLDIPLLIPPEGMGDICFPTFPYASHVRKSPESIADELAKAMEKGKLISKHQSVKGYVNSFVDEVSFVKLTLDSVLALKDNYGSHPLKKEKVILEHTSVNPTGPVHVGRARNPIIGDSLARVLRRAGYELVTEYLVNDVGKQIVLLAYGVRNLSEKEVPKAERGKEDHRLVRFYQEASKRMEKDAEMEREIERMILRFEKGDEEVTKEVRKVSERVLRGIIESLKRIGVQMDSFFWESSCIINGSVYEVVERLKKSDYCKQENGAFYLDLEGFGIHGIDARFFFTRKDGTTLYTTRDLAYHLDKFKRCDIAINVLGEDQKLGMQQLKIALKLMGIGKEPETIFYAFVSLPEGRMSTRKGIVVYLDDLVDEAVERAYEEVKKRREDLSEEDMRRIAEIVGIGALRYNIVRVQAEKKMVFKWEEALNFEGNSAPFLQYAHARACGILSKSKGYKKLDASLLSHPNELKLVKALAKFPSMVEDCAQSRKIHPIASYSYEISSLFNQFYRDCPVLTSEPDLRSARLALVDATRIVLKNALECMGIQAPEEM